MNWTKSQQEAIDKRGKNIIVSAAAGSGKTAVLTQRIIDLIKNDGFDISNMLILTFTNAAANEMRSRIQKKLYEALSDGMNNPHLLEQIQMVSQASISTMHSFCINIVRENFQKINIDPNFKVGNNASIDLLKNEAVEEMIEQYYEDENTEFIKVIDMYSYKNNDIGIIDEIYALHRFIQSKKEPLKWLKEEVELYNMDISDFKKSIYISAVKEDVYQILNRVEDSLKKIINISEESKLPYTVTLKEDEENVKEIRDTLDKGFDEFTDYMKKFKYPRRKSVKNMNVDIEADAFVDSLRKKFVKECGIDKIKDYTLHTGDYHNQMEKMYQTVKILVDMVEEFDKRYKEKKLQNNIVDFNDLEHYTIDILKYDEVRSKVREKYTHIFYDEYQDSNEVQDYIIQSIAKDDNLFFVGDVKQSIYGFRLAEPKIFIKRYHDYEEDEKSCKIDLSENFRSSRQVIDFCNRIFRQIMKQEVANIEYDEKNELVTSDLSPYKKENIQINNIITENDMDLDEDDIISELEDDEIMAEVTAKQILNLVNSGQGIDFKDITILKRSIKSSAVVYKKIFKKYNIPLFIDYTESVFQVLEVSVFVDLLKIIDNIRQDEPLLSVLLSEIGNFEINEINTIKASNPKEKYFYRIFLNYAYTKQDDLSEKMKKFITMINYFAKIERYQDLDEFIDIVLKNTGYEDFVKTMPQGKMRVKNLDIIRNTAKEFMQREKKSLFYFIIYVQSILKNDSDSMVAKSISKDQNIVRFMTIHKSKGLEFNTVILNDIQKNFNMRDRGRILVDKNLGIGIDYIDSEKKYILPTIAKKAIRMEQKKSEIAEEIRILYVALTRAEKRIILNSLEKSTYANVINSIKSGFYPKPLENIINYRDFILYALRDDISSGNEDEDLYQINDINAKDYIKNENDMQEIKKVFEEKIENIELTEDEKQEIEKNHRFKYEFAQDIDRPVKRSVTEMSEDEQNYDIQYLKDYEDYHQKSKNKGKYIGTITHIFLEHIDFKEDYTKDKLIIQAQKMVDEEYIDEEDVKLINIDKIYGFLKSDLGQRIKKSDKIYKEESFIKTYDRSLLSGTVDLCFEEDGKIVLVDYKTDRLNPEDIEEHSKRHLSQIEKYRDTLFEIFKKEIKQSYIYYLSINEYYEVK